MKLILSVCLVGVAAAQECVPADVLVVLDRSSSMTYAIGGTPKWELAVGALESVLGTYGGSIHFGLMAFPDPNQCSPGSVQVDLGEDTTDAILAQLATPPPGSGNYTPMSQTLTLAASYEPLLASSKPNVLLITDGWQWCDPYDPATRSDPVNSVATLADLGMTVWVVGFGDGVDVLTLNQAAAEAGTALAGCDPASETIDGANCYYQADEGTELLAALEEIAITVSKETCNGVDDDCDGVVDGLSTPCETVCGSGVVTCTDGAWSTCSSGAPPCVTGDKVPITVVDTSDDVPKTEDHDDGLGEDLSAGGDAGGCGCSLGGRPF